MDHHDRDLPRLPPTSALQSSETENTSQGFQQVLASPGTATLDDQTAALTAPPSHVDFWATTVFAWSKIYPMRDDERSHTALGIRARAFAEAFMRIPGWITEAACDAWINDEDRHPTPAGLKQKAMLIRQKIAWWREQRDRDRKMVEEKRLRVRKD